MARSSNRHIIIPVIMIVVGGILLLDNLDFVHVYVPHYLRSWEAIVIFIGIMLLASKERPGPGLTLIAIGGIFMLGDIFHVSVFSFWPVIFIIAGIAILMRKHEGSEERKNQKIEDNIDYIDDFALFGSADRMVNSQNFKGGKLSTVFGGAEIDLRNAELAEGRHVLDIFSMFGGSSITVPKNWNVKVKVTAIFGGYADERKNVEPSDNENELIITGFVMFGGGEVKS